MANQKMKNIMASLSDSRTRTVLIFTLILLAVGVVFGFLKLRGNSGPGAAGGSTVTNAPGNIQSIPGGFGTPESADYARLQAQQNAQEAKSAGRSGKSAIPTLISSSSLGQQGFGSSSSGATTTGTGGSTRPSEGTGCVAPGTNVYSASCRVIGTLGPGGVVQSLGPQQSDAQPGRLVYGPEGQLIGQVGSHREVLNAQGQMIGGTAGPDGIVRGQNGQILGQVSPYEKGALVYGPNAQVIGSVGSNGEVLNAQGQVIGGRVGPNGEALNAQGQVIGKASNMLPGQSVFGPSGKLIGAVGPNGEVLNAPGLAIGQLDPSGQAINTQGQVIGEVKTSGKLSSGTPLYDAYGNGIGVVGPNGRLLASAAGGSRGGAGRGGAAGAAGAAGASGAGGAALPGGAGNAAPQMQAIMARQAAQLAAAENQQIKQQMQAGMQAQAGQLISAWNPTGQQYVTGNAIDARSAAAGRSGKEEGLGGINGPGNEAFGVSGGPVIKAGSIMFAVLDSSINSDEPGPILATITSGALKGGKLIGKLTNQKTKVLVTFTTLSYPQFPTSIGINSVAIDPVTAHTGLSDYTNNHYLLRYGSLFAASFLQGYAQAVSQSGSSIVSNGFNTQKNLPSLSPTGEMVVALGNVGTQYASVLNGIQNTPPTVHVYAGTGLGILVLADLKLPEAVAVG